MQRKWEESIIKVGVHCGSNFLTNVYDSDIVLPKFGAVPLIYKTSFINNENTLVICVLCSKYWIYVYVHTKS